MSDGPRYLGLDVGGSKCAALIGDASGRVIERSQWASAAGRGPGAMIADLVDRGRGLLSRHRAEAVGVAIGGPLDVERGVVLSPPNLPGWDAVPLRERLTEALGLPVRVEHDAAACAAAECRWGLGRELRPEASLVYLTCGTGFGVGMVLGGRVYHGAAGRSPEIGHIRYAADGPTAFGKRGSVEAYCAGSSLPRLAAWRFPNRWGDHPPDGPALSRLADGGDWDAQAVLDESARAVGRVCAALADLLFPDAIALGSLARYLGPPWLAAVRRAMEQEALPDAVRSCRLAPAALGERLQDCSCLAAAMRDR